jgi:hypothetical protein
MFSSALYLKRVNLHELMKEDNNYVYKTRQKKKNIVNYVKRG